MKISSATSATPTKCGSIAKPLGELGLGTGLAAGFGALSGHILNSPVGVGGSALYGTIGGLTHGIFTNIKERIPYLAKANTSTSVAYAVAAFFASGVCAWGITNAVLGTQDRFSYPNSLTLWSVTTVFRLIVATGASICMESLSPLRLSISNNF